MEYEYAVMQQVAEDEPKVHSDGYRDYASADRACSKAWDSVDYSQGITVYTTGDAERAAKQIAAAKATRFYVARRPVGPWEEIYG